MSLSQIPHQIDIDNESSIVYNTPFYILINILFKNAKSRIGDYILQ